VLDPVLMRNGHRIVGNAWRRMRLAGHDARSKTLPAGTLHSGNYTMAIQYFARVRSATDHEAFQRS